MWGRKSLCRVCEGIYIWLMVAHRRFSFCQMCSY
uniref:Uncharacterized protein n=1 Tax=Rhizophora mucronata TaxID=61149 RepID=A0A2P2QDA5_RHIMU